MIEKSFILNNAALTYYSEGTGFPLIFIHGFCQDHTIWNEFVKPFTKHYRIILPDNPGFGKSLLPDKDMEISDYADAIKAIIEAEKITSCLMIGHSLGGYITLNFASRFKDFLKGFALFNSTAYPDEDAKKTERVRAAEFVWKNGSAPFVNELFKKLFSEDYYSNHPTEISLLKKYFGTVCQAEGIARASLAMGNRHDTTAVLREATVPVLFIIGKEDKAIPFDAAMTLTHLPDTADIFILPAAGHMGMLEAPVECQQEILRWIELCGF